MKKFKGGLYADLGNYKTTLPNTEILNNFFALNPVGYRYGGMVKGISGGNPTGMKVTGGFLNRAQRYAPGGAVSSYYSPSNVGVRPGDFRAKGNQYRSNVIQQINDLYAGNTYRIGIAKKSSSERAKIAAKLGIPVSDVNDAFTNYKDPIETFDVTKAVKGEKGQSVKAFPDKKASIEQLTGAPTALEEMEGDIPDKTSFMSKEKPVEKEEMPQYTGGEGSSRFGDDGITGLTQEEINKIKQKRKDTEIERELDQIEKPDSTKKDTKQSETLDIIDDKIKENKKNKNKKTTDTNIVSVNGQPKNMFDMSPEDWMSTFQGMSNKDSSQLTEDDVSLSDKIAKALNPEKKDKGKEAPAWAMPLMMAGLQMAASNNPDMLGALGEGGIKGLEEYARIQKEKREDEKYEQEMALKKAGLIFDEERIKLSKDQLTQNQQRLEYDIASDAMKSYQQFSLEYAKMAQQGDISADDLKFKYENLAATMDMEANRLSQDLLKFKADHEAKLQGMSLDERKLELDWYKTETGNLLNSKLITSQIVKNNAQAEAAGFETGSVVDLEIGGKDMKVQIYKDKDGYHIQELGLATDKNSTKLLQAYMKSNPYWFEEYEENPEAFFEKLEAVKDMSDILTDESKDIDLDNIEKIQ
jgi:hypothetical protein